MTDLIRLPAFWMVACLGLGLTTLTFLPDPTPMIADLDLPPRN